jgi:glycosyltransferase involved in cell wall biosynthesis
VWRAWSHLWETEIASRASTRTRVLLVGKGPPDRGGISAFLQTFLDGPSLADFDVHLLNLSRAETPRAARLTWANVARTLSDARSLWKAARDEDIVHLHTALAPHLTMIRAGLLALMAKSRRCKTIVHVHGGRVLPWLRSGSRRLLARICLSPADRVVAVSSGVGTLLAGLLGKRRVVVLENGVDASAFGPPGLPNDPPRILYAGGLTPRKGLLDLFRASEILLGRGVRHEVILVGGTPDEGVEAEAQVRRAATRAVRFLGPQPHEAMPAIYRAADVYCLPSWWEAMPLSVLEAMASGVPIVATLVGDVPQIVEAGVSGRLVPPGDADALAEALQPLLLDPNLRDTMGRAARRRVETGLTFHHTMKAIVELYESVLAGTPRVSSDG